MIKGIIFDQDGVLFDTEQLYEQAWKEAGLEYGLTVDDSFCHAVSGSSGQGMYDIVSKHFPDVDPEALSLRCIELGVEKQKEYVPEKPGLHEILEYCKKRNLAMAVASSSGIEVIENNLKQTDIRSYFDAVVSGQHIPHGKPAPDIFIKAATLLGLKPEECYVIEDSFNGVRAGHSAGCFTYMVPDRIAPTEEIASLYDVCCKNFFEVMDDMEKQLLFTGTL